MESTLEFLGSLPPILIYLVLATGAAIENLFPPIPADTFVLLGGFLSARTGLTLWVVITVTWLANATSALAVYGVGRRLGKDFFLRGLGRYILNHYQLDRLEVFYRRWGVWAIFLTRFLPGLRAVVPGFAGVVREPFLRVALPLTLASGIWYGGLVWLGVIAGRNFDAVWGWFTGANRMLLFIAVAVISLVTLWWWKTRRPGRMKSDAEESTVDSDGVQPDDIRPSV